MKSVFLAAMENFGKSVSVSLQDQRLVVFAWGISSLRFCSPPSSLGHSFIFVILSVCISDSWYKLEFLTVSVS